MMKSASLQTRTQRFIRSFTKPGVLGESQHDSKDQEHQLRTSRLGMESIRMSESQQQAQSPAITRGRFNNVVNMEEVPWQTHTHESGRYGGGARPIAQLIGAQQLGYHVQFLDPGRRSPPFHFHLHEEEVFYVLEGRAVLRQGDRDGEEQIEVRAGDFVAFPAGTGIAHQFINHTQERFAYIGLSSRVKFDVVEYPDSDKVLVRTKGLMVRRTPSLEYFDGET